MAQSKSKIKSVVPSLKNGVHSSYTMNTNTYYEFIVEMENRQKGRASALSQTFRFKEGDEVLYEFIEDQKHGDRMKSFAATEQPIQTSQASPAPSQAATTGQTTSRYKEDPHKQSLIVAQSSLSSAVEWAAAQEKKCKTEDLLDIAWAFESWVLNYKDRRK